MHIRLARALLVGFWVSAAALACDYPVPEDARLRCASDAACPEGFRCEGAIGRCLLRGAAYQPLRAELRGIEPRLVGRGGSTEVRVQVQGAWEEKPRLRVESSAAGREVEAASCDAEQICTFRFSPTLEEGEGSFRVSLRAVDIYAQTLSTDTLGTFEVDQTPPALLDAELSLESSPAGPVVPILAAAGSALALRFRLNEAVAGAPALRASLGEARIPLTLQSAEGGAFHCQWVVAEGTATGRWALWTEVRDLAGNEATLLLAEADIDTTPPEPPRVDDPDAVVYTRTPWGSRATQRAPRFEVHAAAGAVEPGAWLVVYEDSRGAVLGSARADAEGAVLPGTLVLEPPQDRASVFVGVIDPAGNASPIVALRDMHWTATFGGKVAGSLAENPHRLWERSIDREVHTHPDDIESPQAAWLGDAREDTHVTTRARASWRPVPDWVDWGSSRYWVDSVRGRVMTRYSDWSVEAFDGVTWHEVAPTPEGALDEALEAIDLFGEFVFDERRGVAVGFAEMTGDDALVVVEFDGAQWSLTFVADESLARARMDEADWPVGVYDPASGAVLLLIPQENRRWCAPRGSPLARHALRRGGPWPGGGLRVRPGLGV